VTAVGPIASMATIYFNTVHKNKDEDTKHDQMNYYLQALAGLGLIEASEFLPFAANIVGNAADIYDLYIIAANETIARGTSERQFTEYFRQMHPELYARAYGNPVQVIDAVLKDAPTQQQLPDEEKDLGRLVDDGNPNMPWPPEGQ
jgi:hypothetical protein